MVLGISFRGIQKAYPVKNFDPYSRKIQDIIEGEVVNIQVNKTLTDAIITDMKGNIIPHIRTYWFAWYAFHPDTELYGK